MSRKLSDPERDAPKSKRFKSNNDKISMQISYVPTHYFCFCFYFFGIVYFLSCKFFATHQKHILLVVKTHIKHTHKYKANINNLPFPIAGIQASIDPCNLNNYYIFGNKHSNQCWYFNNQNKLSFIKIKDVPKYETQHKVCVHGCAMFETQNKNKYVLIYNGMYEIYDLQTKQWNDNGIKLNKHFMKHKFGMGLSMITDLFEKNTIHIMGGVGSEQKYGYFKFNEQIISNCDFRFVFHFCFVCASFSHIWKNKNKKKTCEFT